VIWRETGSSFLLRRSCRYGLNAAERRRSGVFPVQPPGARFIALNAIAADVLLADLSPILDDV
jgi:hypothetical protein